MKKSHKKILDTKNFPEQSYLFDIEEIGVESLIGKTLVKFQIPSDKRFIALEDIDGNKYVFFHSQECCEDVYVEDIVGDFEKDLMNSPILKAEEIKSNNHDKGAKYNESLTSATWTYYKLATIKGYVDIRWYGSSNGYYSEGVTFASIKISSVKEGN